MTLDKKICRISKIIFLLATLSGCEKPFTTAQKSLTTSPKTLPSTPEINSIYGQTVAENSRLNYSAIGIALKKYRGIKKNILSDKEWSKLLPSDRHEWQKVLEIGGGKSAGLLIPFSSAPAKTSLKEPRIVLTPSTESEFYSRLFIAVIQREDQSQDDFEFISWNHQQGKFDFGVIHKFREEASRHFKFPDEANCHACHQSHTPIFPLSPWDNSVVNRAALMAFVEENQSHFKNTGQSQLLNKLKQVAKEDRSARSKDPIDFDSLFSRTLAKELAYFSGATYQGFPFIDPLVSDAFTFDGAVMRSQSLAFAHEWLQKLPNQQHALLIARDQQLELLDQHPLHYKNIVSYKNPRIKNFNIVAQKENTDIDIPEVHADLKNIEAVKTYNDQLKDNNFQQTIPDHFKPSSPESFINNRSDWQAYFAPWVFKDAFKGDDPQYSPPRGYIEPVQQKHPCTECHSSDKIAPHPRFGTFDPLDGNQWLKVLNESSPAFPEYTNKKLFCLVLDRLQSTESPMPPKDSDAEAILEPLRSGVLSDLKEVQVSFKVRCD